MGYEVERSAKERLDRVAEIAGVSSAVMFEHIMQNIELTDQGLPVTWPANPRDGELPIGSP